MKISQLKVGDMVTCKRLSCGLPITIKYIGKDRSNLYLVVYLSASGDELTTRACEEEDTFEKYLKPPKYKVGDEVKGPGGHGYKIIGVENGQYTFVRMLYVYKDRFELFEKLTTK